MGGGGGKRDIYYRRAKEEGWRARSAYKLMETDEEFNIFQNVTRCIDLCAAPGSWSQVLNKKLWRPATDKGSIRLVAVDIQDMAPIEGVIQINGDITLQSTADLIISKLEGNKAHLVVFDGAPDVSGLHDIDEFTQAQLLFAALNISINVLELGGTFVAKILRNSGNSLVYSRFKVFFGFVEFFKPSSSRKSSIETFIICKNFSLPPDLFPSLEVDRLHDNSCTGVGSVIMPFVLMGDLSGFDSVLSHVSHPSQSPSLPME